MTPTFRVALDLGATHVGFAFEFIFDSSVRCFYDWEGAVNSYCKTSSSVLYQGCNAVTFGHPAKDFGFIKDAVSSDMCLAERILLKLRAGERFHSEVMLPTGVSVEQALSDLLRLLTGNIVDTLLSVFGQVDSLSSIALVIAIPSSMSETTVSMISQCLSGERFPIENVSFVHEAEASLIYAVSRGFKRFHRRLLIVDSGGITTSTTLCTFGDNGRVNCSHGLIELCGSEFTDIKFMKYLAKRLGSVYADLRIRRPTEILQFLKNFESIKRRFSGFNGEILAFSNYVNEVIESSLDLLEELETSQFGVGNELHISNFDLRAMFDDEITKLVSIVDKSLDMFGITSPSSILFVGGFASSYYVQEVLKDKYFGFDIVFPEEPSSAVLRGALMYGQDSTFLNSAYHGSLSTYSGSMSETSPSEASQTDVSYTVLDAGARQDHERNDTLYGSW